MVKKKTIRRLIGKPVKVRWLDSITAGPWIRPKALRRDCIELKAAGYLTLAARDRIVISAAVDFEGRAAASIVIPASAVLSVKRLK